jgi:hypothetical protein
VFLVAVSHTINVQGVREMIQLLDAVQPDSVKELRKEFRQIALPIVAAIKSNIPSTAPLSGMNHYGRTRYEGANVKTELALGNSIRSQARPLATIVVESPVKSGAFGLEIADMAGRKSMMHGPALKYEYKGTGRVGGSGRQKPTKSRKVVRRGQTAEFSYRITGQGKGMTDNLGGVPSRYIYPALAGKEDQLVAEMQRTLDKYSQKINYKLKAA